MKKETFNTPVLFIIFNRPEVTNIVFQEIRKIKPKNLFIAADGPRKNAPEDYKKCEQTREIIKKIDWPCDVKTFFQKENLGCGYGVSTAINWFFDDIEEGIILEDDCVPDQSFFYFCQELLEYYRNNKRIMHISGDNFQYGKKRGWSSYYFSEYTHPWGWATWRRAWKFFDFDCVSLEQKKSSWDKQWYLSARKQNGLAILPNVNLISNIGAGDDATHTKELIHHINYINLLAKQMNFPLIHPKIILRHRLADFFTNRDLFKGSFKRLVFQKLLNITPKPMEFVIKGFAKIIKKIMPASIINGLIKTINEIKWRAKRKPFPPPYFIKQRIIKKYAKKFSLDIFVETGTYLGSTILSVRNLFDDIYSIELDESLFEKAQNKFMSYPHVNILHGDSSKILPIILSKIDKPTLFWLDGHYSAGITAKGCLNTPILKELESILNHKIKNHVILIDDARCFVGKDDYPTIVELELFVKKINQNLSFKNENDIIRIITKQ